MPGPSRSKPAKSAGPTVRVLDLRFDASASQRLHHRLRMSGNHREINSRRPIRTAASLLPILKRRAGRERIGAQTPCGVGCLAMA